ncbi:MAG: uroporphyrinogen decarboxylase family protein [Bacteroidales bacterium]
MTLDQWELLLKVIAGEKPKEKLIGFIIDSPWIPGWYKVSILDYYVNPEVWFEANRKVVQDFSEVLFFPGFWSEFGMCTEPSAFGAKLIWPENDFPFPGKIHDAEKGFGSLLKPDVRKEGLLPFVIKRLVHNQERIRATGHEIKFAVSRGPLNIASFLTGTTEFLMAVTMTPEETRKGLNVITEFIIDWISFQMETFREIDGILILDDIVGFLDEYNFKEFAYPYLKKIYESFPVKVKFFHNDAYGLICAPYLHEMGINLFNFSHEHGLDEMKKLTQNKVTLLGNIPGRDVLAHGSAEEIRKHVREAGASVDDTTRIIWSCGGGMPPDVPTENIREFIAAVRELG